MPEGTIYDKFVDEFLGRGSGLHFELFLKPGTIYPLAIHPGLRTRIKPSELQIVFDSSLTEFLASCACLLRCIYTNVLIDMHVLLAHVDSYLDLL